MALQKVDVKFSNGFRGQLIVPNATVEIGSEKGYGKYMIM